jgi:DNA modification methylase
MTVRIIQGDCRAVLSTIASASIHCCVTSPPYFGLRDYGLPPAAWPACEFAPMPGLPAIAVPAMECCLGLEPDPNAFVAHMVLVFREVHRVLRDDGVLWLNLGDSYAGSWGAQSREHAGKHAPNVFAISANQIVAAQRKASGTGSIPAGSGLKAKDLMGIPWRVAFALQADGWYLRQDVVWSKPNPMPESITDRCTKAHEFVFMLTKSPSYYCDMAAIAEPVAVATVARLAQNVDAQAGSDRVPGKTNGPMRAVSRSGNKERKSGAERGCPEGSRSNVCSSVPWEGDTRNKRSVWAITTQPFSEAHFATMPPELAATCIKAGCPAGGTVLDPFGGAGTTGLVADGLQREAVLIELNPEYIEIARRRIAGDAPLFAEVT